MIDSIELITDRLILKVCGPEFAQNTLMYYKRNKSHFVNALPELPENFYTEAEHRKMLLNEINFLLKNQAIRFYIFEKNRIDSREIVGDVSLYNIFTGPEMSAKMSVKIDNSFTGQGFINEASEIVIEHAFEIYKLHRIEAYIRPDNIAAEKLALKLGFSPEGIAGKLIKKGGKWLDYNRFALINDSI